MTEEKGVVEYKAKNGQTVKLSMDAIKKYLVAGRPELVTSQELIYFIGICKARGLDPFAKDCYLIKYNQDPAAIVTSIDYFRARARAQADCKGWDCGVIVRTKDGGIKETHGLVQDNETLIGGWFEAQPEGWSKPYRLEVNLSGYIKKTKEGNITRFWQKDNQPTMIMKIAEGQGLRKLWPDEFQGIYPEDEIKFDRSPIDMTSENGHVYEVTKKRAEALKEKLEQEDTKSPPGQEQEPSGEETPSGETPSLRDEFINLRSAGYSTWVHKNKERLRAASPEIRAEAEKKWESIYPENPWPLSEALSRPEKDLQPEREPEEDWNGLYYGCPDMDGNPIPKMRCKPKNCKKYHDCPTPYKPAKDKTPESEELF